MRQWLLGVALMTTCSLALTGCGDTTRIAEAIPIPAERMDCVYVADRPALPPEYVIDWSKVTTVEQAHSEYDAYVRSVRTREGKVAGYVVTLENRLFLCASDAQWIREYQAKVPTTAP